MTEAEWLSGQNINSMLLSVAGHGSERKLRLFACACCHRLWDLLDGGSRLLLQATERYCDGGVTKSKLKAAGRLVRTRWFGDRTAEAAASRAVKSAASVHTLERSGAYSRQQVGDTVREAMWAVLPGGHPTNNAHQYWETAEWKGERAAQVALLREIFGNPFRPVAFSPSWRTDTVVQLAKQMYESRNFSAMPILADALQDAGCDNDDVLSHCRSEQTHVRGCWVVDLVLGKG
jgi:hypothetical protein